MLLGRQITRFTGNINVLHKIYKWEDFQTNKDFKTAIFESYLETVFGKSAG